MHLFYLKLTSFDNDCKVGLDKEDKWTECDKIVDRQNVDGRIKRLGEMPSKAFIRRTNGQTADRRIINIV